VTGRRWSLSAAGWRDALLFLTGLGLLVHELVIRTGPERPTVLLVLAGILGVPAFLRADDRRNESSSQEADT
jgi:hypothetical protein